MERDVNKIRERVDLEKEIEETAKQILEYKKTAKNLDGEALDLLNDEVDLLTKKMDGLKAIKKENQEILGLEEKSIKDKSRQIAADYDIADAKKRSADYLKTMQDIDKSRGKYSSAEKEFLISKLKNQRKMIANNIELAKDAKAINSATDQLLGKFGTSISQLKEMKKNAMLFTRALLANPLVLLGTIVAGMALAFADSVKHTREVSKNLNMSLVTSQKLSRELKGMTFSFGFIAEQLKKIAEGDFKGLAKDFAMAGKNFLLGVSESDIVGAMNAMKSIKGEILSTEDATRIAQTATTLGMSSDNMMNVARQMQLAGSGAANINEAMDQVSALAIDMGALEVDNVKDIDGIMKDIAANTEAFAAYGKDGGANMIKAAAHAKKLGLELSSMVKISDSLLEFEDSIEKEMEASLMIGKQLNYDRARALALEGDMAGAAREVANQVGGLSGFNQMNVLQKRSLAASVGLDVSEFQKLLGGGGEEEKDPVIKSQDELRGSIDKLRDAMSQSIKTTAMETVQTAAMVTGLGFLAKKPLMKAGSKVADMGRKLVGKAPKGVSGRNAEAFAKLASEGTEQVAKKGGLGILKKIGGKIGMKGLGVGLKKIPLLGLLTSGVFAAGRAMKGDFAGAGLELASGAASTIPGVGTGTSFALDAMLLARDLNKGEGVNQEAVQNEFNDLTTEQQRQVEQAKSMSLSNQELVETLKLMNENNETQMAEYIAILQQISTNTAQTATNVDGITNN